MANINHIPCITDHEVITRIVDDQREIQKMKDEGYQVDSMVSWQSPSTFECHCLPVFSKDTMEDICNRYYDYFPKECMETMEEVKETKETLYRSNAMSLSGNMMAIAKIPPGLMKMLDIWCDSGDFFDFVNNKRSIDHLFTYMSKFKVKA